jgi:SAM-dependent methyltransferase
LGNKVNNYFSHQAPGYSLKSKLGLWAKFRNKELLAVEKLIHFKIGSSLIDLGSGAGFYSVFYRDKYEAKVLAVESSIGMQEELKKEKINFISIDLNTIESLPNHEFAIAAGVLEFLDDPEYLFKAVSLGLNPQGRLVVLFPSSGFFGSLYQYVHNLWGCPSIIRTKEFYIGLAKKYDLILDGEIKATCISVALSFKKLN